jgi:hypothetical protein
MLGGLPTTEVHIFFHTEGVFCGVAKYYVRVRSGGEMCPF